MSEFEKARNEAVHRYIGGMREHKRYSVIDDDFNAGANWARDYFDQLQREKDELVAELKQLGHWSEPDNFGQGPTYGYLMCCERVIEEVGRILGKHEGGHLPNHSQLYLKAMECLHELADCKTGNQLSEWASKCIELAEGEAE